MFVFGRTFAKNAYWYSNPDVNRFIATLLHIASGGRVSTTANVTHVFKRRRNGSYFVQEAVLQKLGCTVHELVNLLRHTPGGRDPGAAPLIVPGPREVIEWDLPPIDLDHDQDINLDLDIDLDLDLDLDLDRLVFI